MDAFLPNSSSAAATNQPQLTGSNWKEFSASLLQRAAAIWPKSSVNVDERGHVVVTLVAEEDPSCVNFDRVIDQNKQLKINPDCSINPSIPAIYARIAPQSEVIRAAQSGASGFADFGDYLAVTMSGVPLRAVNANLLLISEPAQYQAGLDAMGLIHAFGAELQAVPMIGDFWIQGQKLHSDVLAKLGLQYLEAPAETENALRSCVSNDALRDKIVVLEHGRRGCTLPVDGALKAYRNSQGGLSLDINQAIDDTPVRLKFCAVQWIGCGTEQYMHHYRRGTTEEITDLRPEQVILDERTRVALKHILALHDTRYTAQSGIILDLAHQEGFLPTPIGGFAKVDIALERDRILLEAGAQLSGLTIAEYPLFTKAQLDAALGYESALISDRLVIQQRVVFDDTRRLEDLIRVDDSEITKSFIDSLNTEDSEFSEQQWRKHYLTQLAKTIAHNSAVCFKTGLSVAKNQNTSSNLSVYGRIIDPESLSEPENFLAKARLGVRWAYDLISLGCRTGIALKDVSSTHFFQTFVKETYQAFGPAGEKLYNLYFTPEKLNRHPDPYGIVEAVMGGLLLLEMRKNSQKLPFKSLVELGVSDRKIAEILFSSSSDPHKALTTLNLILISLGDSNYPNIPGLTEQTARHIHYELEFNYLQLSMRLISTPNRVWPQGVTEENFKYLEPKTIKTSC